MFLIIILVFCSNLFSYKDIDQNINKNVQTIVNLSIGHSVSNKNKQFFEIYNNIIGGKTDEFKQSPNINFSTKYSFRNIYRMGFSVSYLENSLYDSFNQAIFNTGYTSRDIVENITLTDIPVLYVFEFNPRQEHQFKSYAGFGAGVLISKVEWIEDINTFDWDIRQGGTNYNEFQFFPTLRFYAGTELGIDKENKQSLLGGITIEPRLNYVFRKIKFFSVVSNQFESSISDLNSSFWFNNFIFELNIGITLNFYHKKKGD